MIRAPRNLFASPPFSPRVCGTHPPTQSCDCEAQEPKRPMRPPLPSLSLNNPMLFFALSSFHLPRPAPALAPGRRHQIPSAAGAAAVLSLVSPPTKPLRRFPSCRPLRRGSSTTPPRITARIGVGTKSVGMRQQAPLLSVRHAAVASMAGAIFMSNTITREQCFQASIFGLPLEYRSFVSHVRKGMPLFLFDHTLRKLYGVFEAASDGGLNINSAAFRSIHRSYPAQVRINIIWKCKPLSEDEFFPAIEDNYYQPRKFYFDLSYEQVVRLYELFGDKRVGRPIHDYPQNECLQTNCSSKGIPDKESLTPDPPHSSNQSLLLVPNISEVRRRYSTPTSTHTDLSLNVEAHPNISMPLGTEINGAQIAPTCSSHHDQTQPFYQNEFFPAASMTDAVSTQVSAPCSETTRHHQLVGQSHPLPHNYPHNILPAGFTAQGPIDESKFVANQLYPLCHGYMHNGLLTSGYGTQSPTYKGMNHLNSTFPPNDQLYPRLLVSNPQSNSQGQCDICFNQGCPDTHDGIHAYEHRCLSEGEVLTTEELDQQGILTCPQPQVTGCDGKTVSAIHQQNMSSTDYIQIPYCDEDFENDQIKHGTHGNASDSSDVENGIVDLRYTQHAVGAENDTKDQCSLPTKGVFSRLSARKQLTSQEATGPTLNQLVSSLSQKTEQWSHKNRPIEDGPVIPLNREQAVDCSHASLNLPSQLDLEEDVSIEPQLPFLNFKRRSEAGKADANLVKEISGKGKRRKLVRPSFEENNTSSNGGEQLKGNCTQDKNQNYQGSENHFDIDLNIPAAPIENNPVEDNRIAVCPGVIIKVQTEKPYGIDTNKENSSNVMETTEEHDPSPAQKVDTDFNIADLNTMDELKLRTILDHTSSLLQALAKLKNGKSDNCEQATSSICMEDKKVNMPLNSDGGHQT